MTTFMTACWLAPSMATGPLGPSKVKPGRPASAALALGSPAFSPSRLQRPDRVVMRHDKIADRYVLAVQPSHPCDEFGDARFGITRGEHGCGHDPRQLSPAQTFDQRFVEADPADRESPQEAQLARLMHELRAFGRRTQNSTISASVSWIQRMIGRKLRSPTSVNA